MPLIKLKHITKKKAYGIWEIQESLEVLKENYQLVKTPLFKSHLRLKQWIAGKILIQLICSKKEIPFKGIDYDNCGKPVLVDSDYKISISHKDNLVVGVVSDQNVGVDIENDLQKLEKVKGKFLNAKEEELYDIDHKNLLPIWAAKECLYKVYSGKKLKFKEQIVINKISKNRIYGYCAIGNLREPFELEFEKYKSNIVVFSL